MWKADNRRLCLSVSVRTHLNALEPHSYAARASRIYSSSPLDASTQVQLCFLPEPRIYSAPHPAPHPISTLALYASTPTPQARASAPHPVSTPALYASTPPPSPVTPSAPSSSTLCPTSAPPLRLLEIHFSPRRDPHRRPAHHPCPASVPGIRALHINPASANGTDPEKPPQGQRTGTVEPRPPSSVLRPAF